MARQYPTFIFQKSVAGKSKGNFVVHNLVPRFVAQIHNTNGKLSVEILDYFSLAHDEDIEKINAIKKKLIHWYVNTILEAEKRKTGFTIYQAYEQLIHTKAIYKIIKIRTSSVYIAKQRLKDGIYPRLDTMVEHLHLAGWEIVQDELWAEPVNE